jgi:MFS family permease
MLEDLRALPRGFWVLFAGTFINRFGTFVWPFLTIYLTRRGYSPEFAGTAIACFGLGQITGHTVGGWLADRFGRRNTIALGAYLGAMFYMSIYLAHTVPTILIALFFAGLGAATYQPASGALIADIVPEKRRLRAYSALRLALNAGFAGGSACAGFLAEHSFFWLFAGDALTTALFGCIAWSALPDGLRVKGGNAPWSEALASMARNRSFQALFIGSLCLGLVCTQISTNYPLHVLAAGVRFDFLGLHFHDTQAYGLLLAWNGFLVVLAELPLTGIILRFHPRHAMAFGYLLSGFGLTMNIICRNFASLFVAMTIVTIGEMACAPVGSAYMARVAPERMRGRYMGVLALSWSLSSIFGPLGGTRLYVAHPNVLWIACGLLGIIGALCILADRGPAGRN